MSALFNTPADDLASRPVQARVLSAARAGLRWYLAKEHVRLREAEVRGRALGSAGWHSGACVVITKAWCLGGRWWGGGQGAMCAGVAGEGAAAVVAPTVCMPRPLAARALALQQSSARAARRAQLVEAWH